jgi:hypothetical protein
MNSYDILDQSVIPLGRGDSVEWLIQFRPIGRVSAGSASHAIRLARKFGWRAPVAQAADLRFDIPVLSSAPRGITTNFRRKGRAT